MLNRLNFGENGLIPAVIQDIKSKKVLTLCYMDANALRKTLEEGKVDQHTLDTIQTAMTHGFDRMSRDIKDLHDELRADIHHIHDRIDKVLNKKP